MSKKAVEFEKKLFNYVYNWALEDGLSIHEAIGCLRIVEHRLLEKWEKDKNIEILRKDGL